MKKSKLYQLGEQFSSDMYLKSINRRIQVILEKAEPIGRDSFGLIYNFCVGVELAHLAFLKSLHVHMNYRELVS